MSRVGCPILGSPFPKSVIFLSPIFLSFIFLSFIFLSDLYVSRAALRILVCHSYRLDCLTFSIRFSISIDFKYGFEI